LFVHQFINARKFIIKETILHFEMYFSIFWDGSINVICHGVGKSGFFLKFFETFLNFGRRFWLKF